MIKFSTQTLPYIKLSNINELEETKIDDTLFKDWIDGNIQTTSLYKDGSNDFKHHSKIVITANTFPSIKIDSATVRRTDAFTHTSKFTRDPSEVDESKNIYLANTNYLNDCLKDEAYLNAFFLILTNYAHNWLTKQKIFKQTNNFNNTKDIIISSNDIIQDFIDKCLTITKKDGDRIGREEMNELFKSNFPKSLITPTQLLSSLRQKDIDYKADYRLNGLKGCYIGIKLKNEDTIDSEPSALDYGFGLKVNKEPDYKALYLEAQAKIKELESKLNLDIDELNNIPKVKKSVKEVDDDDLEALFQLAISK